MIAPAVEGYAVVLFREIDVRTVSPTRRAAIVNWLVTHGVWVADSFTDDYIEILWRNHKQEAELIAVKIEVAQ
jgi:hypothetical protein